MDNTEKIPITSSYMIPEKVLNFLKNTDYSENFQKLLLMDYFLDYEINSPDDFHAYINSPTIANEFSDYSASKVKLSTSTEVFDFKHYHLDSAQNKSYPLEIMLFDTINFDGDLTAAWTDITSERLKGSISPELNDKISGITIFKLSVDIVNRFNNHLEYFVNKNTRSFVKIKEVNIISLEDSIFIGGIRFQFKNRQLSLENIMRILTKLPHMKGTDKKRNCFLTSQEMFSPNEFIRKLFSEALGGECHFQSKRARRMAFIRTEKCIFDSQDICQTVFSRFAMFNKNTPSCTESLDFESIRLDYDALLSISEKGSIALCGAVPKSNSDFLPDEFMKYYYLTYIINWYRQIVEHKLQKHSDSFICDSLECNYNNLFQRKYLNLYSKAAYKLKLY